MNNNTAKPFVKWVGGKGQLLDSLVKRLPLCFFQNKDITYIEPFVGGGAMLFYMLRTFSNIKRVVINDINPELITSYKTVRDNPTELIKSLASIQDEYMATDDDKKKDYYLQIRNKYNTKTDDPIEITTMFFFLNRTCFNGLYRVNKTGQFNVPYGKYKKPNICNSDIILADSELLQKVEILTGDFEQTFNFAGNNTFFYFDPPYRPLNCTSNFNDYAKETFNDAEQVRLKKYCDKVNAAGCKFLLSNSDSFDDKKQEFFFDHLYSGYYIERVQANRNVNANGAKRGKINEVLVRNFNID
ncbi:MAG: DNA adenine methylase [Bacteroidetes bacterium]|uniref:site-specific DNA-methyltransferase (adenine-specific) n=1 Tax=Candidatus Enterocola intestinipullorum TaxID=2840783 RepID=A0A9D9EFJ3_9BACT|nr:DNA adenine methylase [Candidatus Enterocola intestinipullorum]